MDNNNNQQYQQMPQQYQQAPQQYQQMPQQYQQAPQQYQQAPQQYQQVSQQYQQAPQQPVMKQGNASGNGPKNNKGLIIGLVVTGVLLLAAIVAIIILVIKGKDKDKEKTSETSEVSTAADTEEPTTITEVTTEEPTTEQPVALSVDYSNYYGTLTALRYEIECYFWQYGYAFSSDDVIPTQRPIAFTDITGDGIDEMIVVHTAEEVCAALDIYTLSEDGTVVQMMNENWDMQVAGGTKYYLFKTADSDHLFAFSSISDEWTNVTLYEFVPDGSQMTKKELATSDEGPNEDYTEIIGKYTIDGKECTEEEFANYFANLKASATEVVIYNRNQSNDLTGVSELLAYADDISMEYADAVNHVLLNPAPKSDELPILKSIDLTFSSGAGGWSTDLVLNPDGTFTGSYHDSNLGESGDGYESTIYVCDFEGKFKNITKVDDNTYKMELDYCKVVSPEKDEEIIDGMRYVLGEPYGISGGNTFEFYLPGTKVASLPEEFVWWVWGLDNAETMRMFGLYNREMEQGFSSY